MKRVFKTLLTFLRGRRHANFVASPRRHQPFQSRLILEALEDRVVPSTSVFGVPVPPNSSLGLLTVAPVAAEAAPVGSLAAVLGNQAMVGLAVPVPSFLTPAGTTTVTTPLTGPLAITNFEIDNDKLNQLTGNFQPPDPAAISSPGLTTPGGLQSGSGTSVIQLVIPPIRFEWLGLRIESSLVVVTASIEHLGGDILARTEEIIASVARTIEQVVSLVVADLIAAADRVVSLLPPLWLRILDDLAPPTPVSILLAQYHFGPFAFGYQATWPVGSGAPGGVGPPSPNVGPSPVPPNALASGQQTQNISVSQVTVSVFADTGPDKPLGNALVAINQPLSGIAGNSLETAAGGGGMGSSTSSSESENNNSQSARIPVIPRVVVSGAFSMSGSSSRPPKEAATPSRKGTNDLEESPDGEGASPEGDAPLPQVLPEIGLPDDSDSPLPGSGIETTVLRQESESLWELGCQLVMMAICAPQGQADALQGELIVQANGESDSCPMTQIFLLDLSGFPKGLLTGFFQGCGHEAALGIDGSVSTFCQFDFILGSLLEALPVSAKMMALALGVYMDPEAQFQGRRFQRPQNPPQYQLFQHVGSQPVPGTLLLVLMAGFGPGVFDSSRRADGQPPFPGNGLPRQQ